MGYHMELFEYFLSNYGYLAIILILLGGIVGLPIPDEVLLTFIGFYIYKGKLTFMLSFLSASIGAIGGISLSYYLGARLGLPFLLKYGPKIKITYKRISFVQEKFQKYGPVLLFIGFFIPGIRHVTGYVAGISRYNFKRFALYAYSGALLWVNAFLILGHELGYRWYVIEGYIVKYSLYGIVLLCLFIVGFWWYIKWKKPKA